MIHSKRIQLTVAAFAAAILPLLAQDLSVVAGDALGKESAHARMLELAREIESYQATGSNEFQLAPLTEEYARLSAAVGGDDPARMLQDGSAPGALPAGALAQVAVPPACGAATTSGTFPGAPGAIGTLTGVPGRLVTTATVSGVGAYLWDVDLRTFLVHPDNSQLDVTLTSPAGTTVTITTDNGTTLDNGFNGTLWDDDVNQPVTEYTFTNLVTATPLAPEGRLEAFRGENANGVWTLTVEDDTTALTGTLTGWSLDIRTLPVAPGSQTNSWTNMPGFPIPDGGSVVGKQLVAGQGTYLERVRVGVVIPHTESADLDLSLQGPSGTVVRLTTDNGGTLDNVFNGTLFDGRVTDTVTDHVYANLVAATPLSPEAPFDAFRGQDPNGIWTLIATDDLSTDFGALQSWSLELTSVPPPAPDGPATFAGGPGTIPDATPAVTSGTFTFTAAVAGLPTSIWDVDLSMVLTHTYSSDLDMTLRSPAGAVVVITTDNGGGFDDNFNGTLWDDNVNTPATDFVYANGVTAPQLSPEGRLAAFRGQNPNGTWTLTIVDDAGADVGFLHSWGLAIAALAAPPTQNSTTLTRNPNLVISPTGTGSHVDSLVAAGLGASITEVELYLEVRHEGAGDLDITLTSPAGTAVILTTDNGAALDNVFNGTLFDGSALAPVSDFVFTNNVVAATLAPEGSLDNFLGQDPNGTWTLDVADDLTANGGTFVRWDLTVRTCFGPPPPFPFCFGDGTGAACPCGNSGAAGNGCASSLNANGANLAATGVASISSDTLTLLGSGMPNSNALYFQGGSQVGGGLGFVFGDGLRCAGSPVVRLATKLNVGGASQVPSAGDPPISIDGMNAAGNVRTYQVWYRNAAPFCTPDTFNLTNGVGLTWGP